MDVTRIEIDLLPAQVYQLRYPKPVPVAHQNQRGVAMSPAPFKGSLNHRLHFLLKQILAIANFQIRPGIATSFLRRGIRLFSFQKSPAVGELDDSHATPKSNLNILRYGFDYRMLVPPSESDPGKLYLPALSLKLRKRVQHNSIS
jgi:hypothetical protein